MSKSIGDMTLDEKIEFFKQLENKRLDRITRHTDAIDYLAKRDEWIKCQIINHENKFAVYEWDEVTNHFVKLGEKSPDEKNV